jgi:hypothetical protein
MSRFTLASVSAVLDEHDAGSHDSVALWSCYCPACEYDERHIAVQLRNGSLLATRVA